MDSCHEALSNSKLLMDNLHKDHIPVKPLDTAEPNAKYEGACLGKRRQTVGGAAGIGYDIHGWIIFSLIYSHYEHWRISRGCRDHHLLCSTLEREGS